MKIVECNNINSKTVLLQYTSDKQKSASSKSYSISSDKADEFVTKYNRQAKVLANVTAATTITGALCGWLSAMPNPKIISSAIRIGCGAAAGFLLSTYGAYKFNDKLMDKYQVKQYKG